LSACTICERRPAKRFCPAKGEKICAVCCGHEREVTIDCLPSCTYLIAAHRYEAEHRKPIATEDFPYREIQIPPDFVYQHWPIISGLSETILRVQAQEKDLHDATVVVALEALAETYRTLGTGIYYEHPPDLPIPRALYGRLAEFLVGFGKTLAGQPGNPSLKDSDVFQLLVFLLRVAKQETNGRPRSRAFLGFLASRFPVAAEAAQEPSRIIVP
jgi:hypothetical protein